MTEDEQLIADLKAARAEIETRGWCKCDLFQPHTGRVCAVGALAVIQTPGLTATEFWRAPLDYISTPRVRAGIAALAENVPLRDPYSKFVGSRSMVEDYNDSHTEQDVLDLYSKTIANLGGACD